MKCPHCRDSFHSSPSTTVIGRDIDGKWGAITEDCPSCNKLIVQIVCAESVGDGILSATYGVKMHTLAYPKSSVRPPLHIDVPSKFREDYEEAALVLGDSPKASAALTRRCLQHLLRDKAGVKPASLASEIQEVIDSGQLPTYLADAIDAVRNIGNFAAHPMKGTASGEIVSVEPGEAEWNLDVLDGLFDFYFVQPEALKSKRDALNEKLTDAGKPVMKSSNGDENRT